MNDLARKFHAKTGAEVKVNAGPTNALATQIIAGAPADLFLAASAEWADKVADADLAAERVDLLTNRLVIIVPRGNPADVRQLEDLQKPAVKKIALAGENAPAGVYANQALRKLGLLNKLADDRKIVRGQDVRAALSFVARGEAEAGIVYSTDAAIAKDVETAGEIDPALHDEIRYVLVLIKQHPVNPGARRLLDSITSADGLREFEKRGFVPLISKAAN
jgi:molybdate transport system substrate-binding protein